MTCDQVHSFANEIKYFLNCSSPRAKKYFSYKYLMYLQYEILKHVLNCLAYSYESVNFDASSYRSFSFKKTVTPLFSPFAIFGVRIDQTNSFFFSFTLRSNFFSLSLSFTPRRASGVNACRYNMMYKYTVSFSKINDILY